MISLGSASQWTVLKQKKRENMVTNSRFELRYVYAIPKVKGQYKSWIFKCGNLLHYAEKDGYI